VLAFTSGPQAADLEVIGPVRVRLYVQASVAHIDLHARLCDVTARGRSINISDGIVRLTNAVPDSPQPVEFELWPVTHVFRRGTESGCKSPVAPILATGATTAPQNRSPPAHAYRPATAGCSMMPSTRP
jgi:predicted acyl esterase